MSEEFTVERILDADRLLAPVPGSNPSGVLLRNTPLYDQVRDALRPQENAQRDGKGADFKAIIRIAGDLLAKQSKDLDLAAWLTEAMMRQYGLPGFVEGLGLMEGLLDSFWPTLYPNIDPDDGDEGFRAKPVNRLNTAFVGALSQLSVTLDGRSVFDYNASADVATAAAAEYSDEKRKKREKAIAEGVVAPEEFERSIVETWKSSPEFYEQLDEEVQSATAAVTSLQSACERNFKTRDVPVLQKLTDQIDRVRMTVEAMKQLRPAAPPTRMAPPAPPTRQEQSAPESSYDAVQEYRYEPAPEAAPEPEPQGPADVPGIAAALRAENASDPVPYMLLRSLSFGPLLAAGSVSDDALEPPPTELRMAMRKAWLGNDWSEVLENSERAMASPCGGCWLDVQHYAYRACRELGYEGVAHAIRGLTATYLQALPDLPFAVMLDGSATASPDTQVWIRTEVLVDPRKAREESLAEVRPETEDTAPALEREPDAFEVAAGELQAGRLSEAFRILSEALAREQTGRGRLQRKIQLAKICMEGDQHRVALPLLTEIGRIIEERRLDTWEAPEFVAVPLAMLYQCLGQAAGAPASNNEAAQKEIYDRICAADPRKALELAMRS